MKKLLSIFAVLLFAYSLCSAQRYVDVAPDIVDNLAKTIKEDSTARKAAAPVQTIYRLKRNGYYPVVQAIENPDFFLYIKAEDGTGPKPILQGSPTSGTNYAYNINFRSSGKLENLILEALQPTGGVRVRYINSYNGSKIWMTGCEIMHDRGGAVCMQSDNGSIFLEDCFIHSMGHPQSIGGNGRVIDLRTITKADSIVVKNCTFFNLSDRIMRNMGTTVNFVKFDHNTCLVTQGFHGGLQAGKAKELVVTNNIFRNVIVSGSYNTRVAPYVNEQSQPENTRMWVLTIDTTYQFTPKITVRNNNIYWEKKYTDIWETYKDSTKAPGILTPTIMKALGADSMKAYFTDLLTFTREPSDLVAFTIAAFKNPNSTTLPQNWWYIYQPPPANDSSIIAAYGTAAKSYTAGDGGLPVGDLNWYPAKKQQWLTGVKSSDYKVLPSSIELSQNYPNPFNPATVISYTLNAEMKVSLSVFNILGEEVASLVNQVQAAGSYKVDFDASKLGSGVYVYQLKTPQASFTKKMMLVK